MSYASKVLYTGDGVVTQFNVPMPYISKSHINVYVNETLMIQTMHFTWSGDSTIVFKDPPGVDSAIRIQRWTSPTATLVDFVNGSVLNESDLDTAYLHSFYLSQEYSDSFNEAISDAAIAVATDAGLIDVDADNVIDELVNLMLDQTAANELQQRVVDIDANAEAIIEVEQGLQTQINTLAQGVAAVVYIQPNEPIPGVAGIPDPITDGARWYDSDDNNHPYIYDQVAVLWLDLEDPRIGANESAIDALQVTVDNPTTGVVANATGIDVLDTTVYHPTTGLTATASRVTDLETTIDDPLTGFVAVSSAVDSLEVTVNDGVDGVVANATKITNLTSTVGGNTSAISDEAGTRASETGALAFTFGLLGAENLTQTAFILNSSTVKIDSDTGDTFATRFTHLSVTDAGLQQGLDDEVTNREAAITNVQNAYIAGDVVVADELHLLGAQNAGGTAFILDQNTTKVTPDESLAQRFNAITVAWTDGDTTVTSYVDQEITTVSNETGALASVVNLIGVENVGSTAFILNENTVKINSDSGDTFAERFTQITADWTAADGTVTTNANAYADVQVQAEATARGVLASEVHLIGAENVGKTAFILDSNTVKIDSDTGDTFAEKITSLELADSGNSASINTIQTVSIPGVQSDADAAQAGADAAQLDADAAQADANTALAKYGVTLDVNGYISGFIQNNDGQSGNFVVLADKFAVVTPSTTWQASTVYSLGDTIRPTTANSRVYECTTAGTSGTTEPTWTTTIGVTNSSGSAIFTCRSDATLQPFLVSGNNIVMNGNVEINGNLILNGTIVGDRLADGTIGVTQMGTNSVDTAQLNAGAVNASKIEAGSITANELQATDLSAIFADLGTITAGTITFGSTFGGHIKGGQTAFNTGTGFFLGYESSAYKFSIGNGTDNYMTWDGTTLQVIGDILVGEYVYSDTVILSATTERQGNQIIGSWYRAKTFEIDRAGSVKITFDMRQQGGGTATNGNTPASVRVYKNTTIVSTESTTDLVDAAKSVIITNVSAGDQIHCDLNCGTRWIAGDLVLEERLTYINDVYIKADVQLTTGGSVIKD